MAILLANRPACGGPGIVALTAAAAVGGYGSTSKAPNDAQLAGAAAPPATEQASGQKISCVDPTMALEMAYRTTPLRGLWQHAPYFHDGSAVTLTEGVAHCNRVRTLGFTAEQQQGVVEYRRSLYVVRSGGATSRPRANDGGDVQSAKF